jgi:hypothetical protein
MKTKKKLADQQALFDAPGYGWKSVQQIERHDMMVVSQQEVKILGIRQDGGVWWVSYIDPETDVKTEQFYNAQDFIYVRLKAEMESKA